ncbi:MAG: hypothetical protein LBB75_07150 [Oscillospiraceae bacterium]|jgi:hypothetical protein|nr:hypothetical protein [Oscillospiraceae bacterium]
MICDKCGTAYVSENCPGCEDAAMKKIAEGTDSCADQPKKRRTGLRKLKKASIAILVLALAAISLVAGYFILEKSGERAEEKAKKDVAQHINDEIAAQMQALYPDLTRTDILALYAVVDETETGVDGYYVIHVSPAEAELHVAKALSYMRTYMNAAKENGVTDMAVIIRAIREQYEAKRAMEKAEREAQAAADEAKAKADDEHAKAKAEEAKAKAEEAKAIFGALSDALRVANEAQ